MNVMENNSPNEYIHSDESKQKTFLFFAGFFHLLLIPALIRSVSFLFSHTPYFLGSFFNLYNGGLFLVMVSAFVILELIIWRRNAGKIIRIILLFVTLLLIFAGLYLAIGAFTYQTDQSFGELFFGVILFVPAIFILILSRLLAKGKTLIARIIAVPPALAFGYFCIILLQSF